MVAVLPRDHARHASRGVAADELRRHNLSTVLTHLHINGPASRSELTSLTGLNRSTIADLIEEMLAAGVVQEEQASRGPGPGRPSPVVRVRPQGAVVLALDLAVDSLAVATVGLGGHIFNEVRIDRPRGRFSPEATVEDAWTLAQPLLASLPDHHSFVGVGAAVVGVTRRSDGFVHIAPNLGWRGVALGELLANVFDTTTPVSVANEADLGALGEQRRGVGAGIANLVFISGEVGLGAGVIIGGQPLLGVAGYAGEAGHMLVNPDGLPCGCGSTGCWETEASEGALCRHAGLTEPTGRAAVDLVLARAAEGDERSRSAITTVGRWLGLGIADLINLLNPEVVVVGGLFYRLFPYLEEAMRAAIQDRVLEAPGQLATIRAAALGANAPLLGAAELALSHVLTDPSRADQQTWTNGRGAPNA